NVCIFGDHHGFLLRDYDQGRYLERSLASGKTKTSTQSRCIIIAHQVGGLYRTLDVNYFFSWAKMVQLNGYASELLQHRSEDARGPIRERTFGPWNCPKQWGC